MRVLAVTQARMSSTRLPGKVLRPILGAPMLARQIERTRRAESLDDLLVATSTDPSDDVVVSACEAIEVGCRRGSLYDVLDRFHQVAIRDAGSARPDHVVRLTADCPLLDWRVIDRVVETHLEGGFDYTSNIFERRHPVGLDVEVMTVRVLETAWREATTVPEREHVTPFLRAHPERFRLGSVVGERDLSALRLTVDTAEDFERVRRIYEALYPKDRAFTTEDVVAFLARSDPAALEGPSGSR